MNHLLIKNALCVNEGRRFYSDILIRNGRIEKISEKIETAYKITEIPAEGQLLIPGLIDDQVHFREPGLTHKATIGSESKAALAGGVTSFMEMPNTNPPATTQALLEEKYEIASRSSFSNYSFFMGTTNHNYDEVMRCSGETVCGLKIFMGSSTGDMLVDDDHVLSKIFANFPYLIATHCEDEATIRQATDAAKAEYGEQATAALHPIIRSEEACFKSSSLAVELAKKHGSRLHILHISSLKELSLFSNEIPLAEKKITAELCVHHLWFTANDYETLGNRIKCNPAIKSSEHAPALLAALLDNRLDIIATDHAPHTIEEKSKSYFYAPSGLPLVQHSLQMLLDFERRGKISLEKIVEKACHAPAVCFKLRERGFLREGYHADLVLINRERPCIVNNTNILYKCGWSPLEGHPFHDTVEKSILNGFLAYDSRREQPFLPVGAAQRLLFNN